MRSVTKYVRTLDLVDIENITKDAHGLIPCRLRPVHINSAKFTLSLEQMWLSHAQELCDSNSLARFLARDQLRLKGQIGALPSCAKLPNQPDIALWLVAG